MPTNLMDGLNGLLGDIDAKLDELEKEYRRNRGAICSERSAVRTTIKLSLDQDGLDLHISNGVNVCFDGAQNHDERLMRIVAALGPIVNATEAADRIIAAGVAKGQRQNLVSTLFGRMRDDPEWNKVRPGTFEYVGNHQTQVAEVAPSEDDDNTNVDLEISGGHRVA